MSNLKLKQGKEIFIKYKNSRSAPSNKYEELYNDTNLKAKEIIEELEKNKLIINNNILFTFVYKNIPSKSNRIKMRENILDLYDIPQIDMVSYYDGYEYFSRITYLITSEEYNILLEKLKFLKNIYIDNENDFLNLKAKDKQFISRIFYIKNIMKREEKLEIEVPMFVKILPIFTKEKMLKVFDELMINVDSMDWGTYIMLLKPIDYKRIMDIYPYLIGEIYTNELFSVNKIELDDINDHISLSPPRDVTIGVIDSGINLPSIFDKYYTTTDKRQLGIRSDKTHGSGVVSIIIANDKLNPGDGDNFGQFKVKHFELLEHLDNSGEIGVNNVHLFKEVENIVRRNSEIKIWNLSFGSKKIPFTLNVSPLGKLLDVLSMDLNCLFIVAAGNEGNTLYEKSIATPADSLNAFSVGSVCIDDKGGVTKSDYSSWGRKCSKFCVN